ncbi:Maf family nucleotide pyrophosphatase [Roseomonas xinghualingensis]|uniref:Maf family nucleotide pyrophosphatase n=1 Tax=Roseomonas xinghualingensis TaxID=2986475 RepID=UPI0021F163DC|nr:Maf family nucleotide pyrophosphatase [Roseomonas sp. SXEYE001]MCV4205943.1 Maf family nucleotide pyrophosphatase [Roseomonas sp. SXEYE001]
MRGFQAEEPGIVLASASAARKAVLEAAGLRFEAIAAAVDEGAIKESARAEGYSAADAAMMLAEAKARRIAARRPEALVIGCDQMLVLGDRWFDKPESVEAARGHLEALRGQTHQLVTAVLCWRGGQRIWQHVATPRLTMRPVSDAFIDAYLALEGETVTSSVGAYRLEGAGIHLFDRVEGEYAAILGLPLLPLLGFLRQHGVLMG